MTYAGAGGETAAQIAEVLSFSLRPPELGAAFGALKADLVTRGTAAADADGYMTARALHIANALWGDQTYRFSRAYSDQLEASYGARLHQSHLIHAPEAARSELNNW